MNERELLFRELNEDQKLIRKDAVCLYEEWLAAREEGRHLAGGMCWKKSKGNEYLFRLLDRYGNGKSLGRRSTETEKMFIEYKQEKQKAAERLSSFQVRLRQQAGFCKAAGINRVPTVVCGMLRLLEGEGLLGAPAVVVGTNAMYAYEDLAGVRLEGSLLATQGLALSWDGRSQPGAARAGARAKQATWLTFFRKADRSFKIAPGGDFAVVNDKGYTVRVLDPVSGPTGMDCAKASPRSIPFPATEDTDFPWLLTRPKVRVTVIGSDGLPVTMRVPDPKSFLLHKQWLSRQEGREPPRSQQDQAQASVLAELLDMHIPGDLFDCSGMRASREQVGLQTTMEVGRDLLGRLKKGMGFGWIDEEDRARLLGLLFELNKSIVPLLRKPLSRK